jgi:hypothetical protein
MRVTGVPMPVPMATHNPGRFEMHVELRRLDSGSHAFSSCEAVSRERQKIQLRAQVIDVGPDIKQGAEHHVAADPGKRLEVNDPARTGLGRLSSADCGLRIPWSVASIGYRHNVSGLAAQFHLRGNGIAERESRILATVPKHA